ncbi:hypothetical protein HHK36_012029 [Tetracentron sinense]|uniref:Trichome birefringence-like N-terminal domain-containing protein n=1 Tax=Tetracentron sinense TaxID=13715 RepID=A0A835DGV8_TETSI|nr:hypothetical protein HHK36_012029 [Tetracentron sinense]
MVDATKQVSTEGNLVSDLKILFSVLRTRGTMAFAYGFMFAFVVLTVFLVFSPSANSSSPWFTNIFTSNSNSNSNSSSSSDSSYRSQFSSDSNLNFSRSQNTTLQIPGQIDERSSGKNQSDITVTSPDKGGVLKANQTMITAPHTPVRNQTVSASPQSFNGVKKDSEKHGGVKNGTKKGVAEKTKESNFPASPSKWDNGTSENSSAKQGKENLLGSLMQCNIFYGRWVRDDSYPLYPPGSCSHIDEPFDCFLNGRPDGDYQKLRWQPKGCNIPRYVVKSKYKNFCVSGFMFYWDAFINLICISGFCVLGLIHQFEFLVLLNGRDMLELLRGKRLVFVGDSLNRNMWESLVCTLRNSVKDKSKVFEASGRREFRTEGSYSFLFKDYNCTVEFFRSPFLVQEWEMPDTNGSKKETLRLDIIERSSDKYKNADIIIFNTGHWWTHEKTSKGKDYYQEGSHVYGDLNVVEAFRKALTTWARWVDANINPKTTLVFFRGYSVSHFSGGQWNSGGQCDSETDPIKNETYLSAYPPKMRVLESVMKGMKTPVSYLNITRMTDYRKDAHPSIYRKQHLTEEERKSPLRFQDCSHWCLPGVPDTWNELLYAQLLIKQNQKQQQHQKRPQIKNTD